MFGFFRARPKDLRSRVFEAVAGPRALAVALCRRHQAEIGEQWPTWAQQLFGLQGGPEAQKMAQCMHAVAEIFANELGDPRLMRLFGDSTLEPLYKQLSHIRELIAGWQLQPALPLLMALLQQAQKGHGDELMKLRSFIYGDLGQVSFFLGDLENAEKWVRQALRVCEVLGDKEGLDNHYLGLFELLRYQDRREEARSLAQDRAGPEWQRRAQTVVDEPLIRVVLHVEGRAYELDALPRRRDGRVQAVFVRNRIGLATAEAQVEAGRRSAEGGDVKQARACFEQAAQKDPYDPESRMLLGLLALDEGNFEAAVARLEESDRLGPGFYHVRSDLWFARQLANGAIPMDVWRIWRELEDGPSEPIQKLGLSATLLERCPLAAGHFQRGVVLQKLGRGMEAQAALEKALELDPEPHLKTRILFQLGGFSGDRNRLQQAVDTQGCLVSAAMARWLLQPA
jgi:tetratricopeptide (TPR) repeat protein